MSIRHPRFFLAIHIIVPISLTGRKNDIFFDEFIYQNVISGGLSSSQFQLNQGGRSGVQLTPHSLRQQKRNFWLPKVPFLFIQAAGLAYHHDAVVHIISPYGAGYHHGKAVDIIKGGKPPLYLITRQRASSCGLMIYNTSC